MIAHLKSCRQFMKRKKKQLVRSDHATEHPMEELRNSRELSSMNALLVILVIFPSVGPMRKKQSE
jgi:hypothetical protein